MSIPENEIVLRAFPREGYLLRLRLRQTDRGYEMGLWRLMGQEWFPVRPTIFTFRNKRQLSRAATCLKAVALPEGERP